MPDFPVLCTTIEVHPSFLLTLGNDSVLAQSFTFLLSRVHLELLEYLPCDVPHFVRARVDHNMILLYICMTDTSMCFARVYLASIVSQTYEYVL